MGKRIDVTVLPDELIRAEFVRRFRVGRPPIMRECPRGCGAKFGVRAMVKHLRVCGKGEK